MSSLKRHIKSLHDGVRYNCDKCSFSAKFSGELRDHKKVKHEGLKFICNLCEFQTTSKTFLYNLNLTIHKGIKCGKEFNASAHFRKHVKVYHKGYRHECNLFSYKARNKHTVKKHKENFMSCLNIISLLVLTEV
jgi:hypothetical protein